MLCSHDSVSSHRLPNQVMHSSKVYLKLNERLGLSDHSMVLNIMLRCARGGALQRSWQPLQPHPLKCMSACSTHYRLTIRSPVLRPLPAPQQDCHQPQGVWQLRGCGGADADAVPGAVVLQPGRVVQHQLQRSGPGHAFAPLPMPSTLARTPSCPAGPGCWLHERQAAAEAGRDCLPPHPSHIRWATAALLLRWRLCVSACRDLSVDATSAAPSLRCLI